MKKLIITFLFMITALPASNAQFTMIGGGLDLSSGYHFDNVSYDFAKSGILAISFKGIYEINLPFHISPSFTYFLPHVWKESTILATSKITESTMMFDVNTHYVFNSLDKFEFYGLAGLDVLLATDKHKFTTSTSLTETIKENDIAIGLNLGVGTYMKMTEQFDLFGEAKYIFSKYDQFIINVGILINIDWLKKHENSDIMP
jgi:hypothetical protein